MRIYTLCLLVGLPNLYILLLYWGFSVGPANYIPIVSFFCASLLYFICSIINLFLPKVGATLAIACTTATLVWQIAAFVDSLKQDPIGGLVFGFLLALSSYLIYESVKLLLNKSITWKTTNTSVKEKWKPFFAILPYTVLLLYLL
ncbi:hypothetical protein [Spirosoma litoris]